VVHVNSPVFLVPKVGYRPACLKPTALQPRSKID